MSATEITVQDVKGPYPLATPMNSMDVAFTPADTLGNVFECTGRELLVMKNTGASAGSVLLQEKPNQFNRHASISCGIGVGKTAIFWFGATDGWIDGDGKCMVIASADDIHLAVLRLSQPKKR